MPAASTPSDSSLAVRSMLSDSWLSEASASLRAVMSIMVEKLALRRPYSMLRE